MDRPCISDHPKPSPETLYFPAHPHRRIKATAGMLTKSVGWQRKKAGTWTGARADRRRLGCGKEDARAGGAQVMSAQQDKLCLPTSVLRGRAGGLLRPRQSRKDALAHSQTGLRQCWVKGTTKTLAVLGDAKEACVSGACTPHQTLSVNTVKRSECKLFQTMGQCYDLIIRISEHNLLLG